MRRWLYYHLLTLLDLVRLWPSVQQQVIIVAGICLPILMLLGLKNGHVAELRRELLTSPTGREVVFWSAQHGELLRPSTVDSFGKSLGKVDLIIPEIHRVVSLAAIDTKGSRRTVENVTLYSTRLGDPILAQHRADVLTESEQSLVLAEEVARLLGIGTGDTVTATVQRVHEGVAEKATIDLKVKQVVPLGSEIGYADINLLTAMEQYIQGFQVRRFGWPAFAAAAADEYDSYLIFCEKTSLLTDEDMRTVRDRGFVVEQVQDKELANLYGQLVPEANDKLTVYRLAAHGGGRDQWQRLRIAPSEIARITEADDVVVPWSDPKILVLDRMKHRVIGFSIPDRTWLRLYFRAQNVAHRYDTDTFSVALPSSEGHVSTKAALEYAKGAVLSLEVAIPTHETDGKGKPETITDNTPAAKQSAVERPVDAKAKPMATIDISGREKPTTPAEEDPGVKENSGAKQPPAREPLPTEEIPIESKTKLPSTRDTSKPRESATSGKTEPSTTQPTAPEPTAASAKSVPTPDTGEAQKPSTPAKVQSSAKHSPDEKRIDGNSKSAAATKAAAKPGVTEKPPTSAGTEPGAPRRAAEEAEQSTANAAAPAATSGPAKPGISTKAEPDTKVPPVEKPPKLPLAVVPVELLAYLHAFDAGRVEYDAARRLFVPTPREPVFERARLYASTIDDVPTVVGKLKERQFAVMSQSTRISEIHQQDFSLQLLVLIVGAGVFLFGVVTVVTVLLDSTERKRGTIGILRVMGVPRTAVFYMVFLRAAVIGSLAAGFTLGLGYLAGHVLGWEPSTDTTWASWKPVIKVIIEPKDAILVVAGALACCGLGSLIPAFRASRLDPFDAIVEGRFR